MYKDYITFEDLKNDVDGNSIRKKRDNSIDHCACCEANVRGDAHYTTFDTAVLNFQGTCSYVLSEYVVSQDRPDLPAFKIIGTNDHPKPRMQTRSVLVVVTIIYNGHEVIFQRNGNVQVDGINIIDDYAGDGFKVEPGDDEDRFEADSGVVVAFNSKKASAIIDMPTVYEGHLSGMLGNYNGDDVDDIRDADGNPRPDGPHGHCLIGNSYQVEPVSECSFECP
jgi:hypothetical protein